MSCNFLFAFCVHKIKFTEFIYHMSACTIINKGKTDTNFDTLSLFKLLSFSCVCYVSNIFVLH